MSALNLTACRRLSASAVAIVASSLIASCGATKSDQLNTSAAGSGSDQRETLYVASGGCYGGGVALSTGSGTIAAFDTQTGSLKRIVIDYSAWSQTDFPVSIADYDLTRILVTVENASGGRRVELVNKDGSGSTNYYNNTTALSGILRDAKLLSDGSVLINKTTAIEKISSSKSRLLQTGAVPWVNNPASTCATTATMITDVNAFSNGKIIYAHSAATPNNKVVVIGANGYGVTADCLATQAAPQTTSMPTAVLLHSSGKVIVAYGSTTSTSNLIYSYPFNISTNVFGTGVSAYSDNSVVNGPSAITEDLNTTDVFVANALSTSNNVERFSFDSTAGTLTRSSVGRINTGAFTKCISAMKVIRGP